MHHNAAVSETSFFGLIGNLGEEIKLLVKDEVRLAKTELSEKVSKMAKNAVWLVIGGIIAYTGFIVLLVGLGALIAHFFERGGMDRFMAIAVGMGIVAFVFVITGVVFLMKALAAFKKNSLTPEKTIDTLQHMRETVPGAHPAPPKPEKDEKAPKESSDEIKSEIDVTQNIMKDTVDELRYRMTPRYMKQVVVGHVRHHPLRTGIIGALSSAAVGFLVMRKRRHSHSNGVVCFETEKDA